MTEERTPSIDEAVCAALVRCELAFRYVPPSQWFLSFEGDIEVKVSSGESAVSPGESDLVVASVVHPCGAAQDWVESLGDEHYGARVVKLENGPVLLLGMLDTQPLDQEKLRSAISAVVDAADSVKGHACASRDKLRRSRTVKAHRDSG
jgi:hypothetical protein